MRILLYSYTFPPEVGGIESIVLSLAKGLALYPTPASNEGLKITLVTNTPPRDMDDSIFPFSIIRRPSLWRLFRLLRRSQVVHLAGPAFLPLVLSLLLHKPVVIEHHGFQAICPNGQLFYEPTKTLCPGHFMAGRHLECLRCNVELGKLTSLRIWLVTFPRRLCCRHVAANIAPTDWLASYLQLPRLTIVHHGLVAISPPSIVRVSSSVPTFAFLGRLVTTKGARLLIEAAHILRKRGFQFRIRIIGAGPARPDLERLVRDFRLEDILTFLGHVPSEHLEENLTDANAIVVPSLAGEVFGLVAAENMQRGRVVIASDIGALREVVGPAGLCFAAGNATALADCMQRVLESPNLAEELGNKARNRILEQFSQAVMVESHVRIYCEAGSR
jgi:glycogen synthase